MEGIIWVQSTHYKVASSLCCIVYNADDLAGVMRFLQSEWLRHERDRNVWEIEQAEMKSRISKLEGDRKTAQRLQSSLQKHVKMLEMALRAERETVRKLRSEGGGSEKPDNLKEDDKSAADCKFKSEYHAVTNVVAHLSNVDLIKEKRNSKHSEIRQDTERDKSRHFLSKCLQEATYHIIPTAIAQQALSEEEQILQNHYQDPNSQPSLEELYAQRQKQQNHVVQASINHQGPAVDQESYSSHSQQAPPMARSTQESAIAGQPGVSNSVGAHNRQYFPEDDQVEKLSFSFDSQGQQIAVQEEERPGTKINEEATLTDGWNFDVDEVASAEQQPTEYIGPQRPDTDVFPSAHDIPLKSPPRGSQSRRKSSLPKRRQSDGSHELRELSIGQTSSGARGDLTFKVRFALRGHLDVVRSVIFTGGGTPAEPEICTTGDDGVIKRWTIPASYGYNSSATTKDLDINSYFTHRGHIGPVTCLAAAPASRDFLNGGRALGDGWVFSGGQDSTVRVWERGRVDPKATLDGHTDAVWTVCVLPGSANAILGDSSNRHGASDKMLLASGAADGTILIWAVSSPPQLTSPGAGSRRGAGGSRRANSISSGSNFPSSPQPNTATNIPFHSSLVHRIERTDHPSPTCITSLSPSGDNFVVSFADASILIYDTRTAEEIVGMASQETYDGALSTGINAVAATTASLEGAEGRLNDEESSHNPTGSSSGIEGMVISGHEDRYIRFFDANSGTLNFP